jgi:hypothetical protein
MCRQLPTRQPVRHGVLEAKAEAVGVAYEQLPHAVRSGTRSREMRPAFPLQLAKYCIRERRGHRSDVPRRSAVTAEVRYFTALRIAAAIRASSGMTKASSGSLYGMVVSCAVTWMIGAFSDEKRCSTMSPAMMALTDA